jgi:hypothetical protein
VGSSSVSRGEKWLGGGGRGTNHGVGFCCATLVALPNLSNHHVPWHRIALWPVFLSVVLILGSLHVASCLSRASPGRWRCGVCVPVRACDRGHGAAVDIDSEVLVGLLRSSFELHGIRLLCNMLASQSFMHASFR